MKILLDSQLSPMDTQTSSVTFNSEYFAGSGSTVMLAGTSQSADSGYLA